MKLAIGVAAFASIALIGAALAQTPAAPAAADLGASRCPAYPAEPEGLGVPAESAKAYTRQQGAFKKWMEAATPVHDCRKAEISELEAQYIKVLAARNARVAEGNAFATRNAAIVDTMKASVAELNKKGGN